MNISLQFLKQKAEWRPLNEVTRRLTSKLILSMLFSLMCSMACAVVVIYDIFCTDTFQFLGLMAILNTVVLLCLTFLSNTGVAIRTIKRHQRLKSTVRKITKGRVLFSRAVPGAPHRAGHARARRRQPRSASAHTSKNNSDGEPDPGDLSAFLFVLPLHITFFPFCIFYKLHCLSPLWHFSCASDSCPVLFNSFFAQRRRAA